MQPATYDYSFSEKQQIERYQAEARKDELLALTRQARRKPLETANYQPGLKARFTKLIRANS